MKFVQGTFLLLLLIGGMSCQEESQELNVASTYFDALFKRGDFETIKNLLGENATYIQAEGLPYGGRYNGFDQWMGMFGQVSGLFDLVLVGEPKYYVKNEKGTVIVEFKVRFTSKVNGHSIEMPVLEIIEVKNDKISQISPYYFDTKAIADLSLKNIE